MPHKIVTDFVLEEILGCKCLFYNEIDCARCKHEKG